MLTSRTYKRRLEYLFYVPDPDGPSEENETLHILEEGFFNAEQYKVLLSLLYVVVLYFVVCTVDTVYMLVFKIQALGREGAVPLSNSLTVADKPRMERAFRQGSQCLPLSFSQGLRLLCKNTLVFVGVFVEHMNITEVVFCFSKSQATSLFPRCSWAAAPQCERASRWTWAPIPKATRCIAT